MKNSKNIEENLTDLAARLGLERISQALYFPKYFEVETIRACNAHCDMCTVDEWKGKNNRMDALLFDNILDEISRYSEWIDRVCLSRNGEPLLDRNLVWKIKKLKESKIKYVTFSTNASLLDEKRSLEIIESGLDDIRFSIDGYTKETFEKIRKGLNFEEIRENCLNFIRLRNEHGSKPVVQIRMALQSNNAHEEEAWKHYWLERVSSGDIVTSKKIHSWGNQLKSYSDDEYRINKYSYVPCISPWSTMVIHFDGKVPLCGCDYNNVYALGDINNQSIKEIWQSEAYNRIRKIHSDGKRNEIPLCKGCNVWDIYEKYIHDREKI